VIRHVSVRIVSVGGREHLAWAEGKRFTLPRSLIDQLGWSGRLQTSGDLALPSGGAPPSSSDAHVVREQAAFTDRPPATSRLPFSYQRVPGWMRALGASIIGRLQRRNVGRWASFPGWPLDLTADFLADFAGGRPSPIAGGRTPVVITHDIDSSEGLTNLRDTFLPLEETCGARSVNYIVPCAWPLDSGALDAVVARGHELGIHGYDHSNRTPFAMPEERRRRLDAARSLVDRYKIAGYRAPSLLRTRALLRDLSERYLYDSSIPTSGGLFPVPNNGCASARPFVVERIVELPLTLPRDGSLRFLGLSASEIGRMWIECGDAIAESGGVVMLLTHCERRFSGNPPMLEAYRRFLEYVAGSDRFTFALPADLLASGRALTN
jgi:peptidoglycan/xylan/chitin deacetylase (PgdA/CDA1 family)